MLLQMGFYIAVLLFFGIFIGIILLIWFLTGIKVILEYQRRVVFRLGKYTRTIGPGVVYVLPFLEKSRIIDLRIITADIPRQEVITKDNIPVIANTVVYYKVEKPEDAIIKIENYKFAVQQYTQTALRDVLSSMELDSVLTERERVATAIREIVDAETEEWGIDIKSIKLQEIELPDMMKRAMAAQAEAEREKRAAIIGAQGELEAAENLQKAAALMSIERGALHLRTLHTIRDIAQDPSQKIVIFLPSIVEKFLDRL